MTEDRDMFRPAEYAAAQSGQPESGQPEFAAPEFAAPEFAAGEFPPADFARAEYAPGRNGRGKGEPPASHRAPASHALPADHALSADHALPADHAIQADHALPVAGIDALYQVIAARRDVRNGFRPDPIADDVLTRVLTAAHQAPSVGLSQPWDFIVVRDRSVRERVHQLARRQQAVFAAGLPGPRARAFRDLKVEAILDTPLNIVVTCDATRGGRHVLGRHAQPQVATYSTACAVQNLWLAARAEGLGVGWVSFFDEHELAAALGLPPHLDVVAYLCVGYVDAFPPAPELVLSGWARRRPLAWAVHDGQWGHRGLPGGPQVSLLADTLAAIRPLDAAAVAQARERQEALTKPSGSLGVLEHVSVQLAGLAGECPPPLPEPAAVAVFAGDHGVHAQGVTPWPQEVTAQMVANFLASGAVVNAIAAQAGAEVCVVDVGVAADLPAAPGLLPRKIRPGTADMTAGPAMSRDEALRAVEAGIETARDLVTAGNACLLTGDMGIANTTASAALIAVFTGADPEEVTGRGTGIDDPTWQRKVGVVRRALERNLPDPADPLGVLAAVGGLEHAALTGFILGGAALRVPVVLDGVIAGAAALAARALAPDVLGALLAGHMSTEPGARRALDALGLTPLLDLGMRLGEGSGAALALPVIAAAARVLRDVATFDSAGVSGEKG
jgi:nicotinate-nucleotide--dimethylbenzimidazole phosphoribosyltransferase